MKRCILLATVAAVATFVSAASQATPYLDPVLWLNAANPGSRLGAFPSQSLLLEDSFGKYTFAQAGNPVRVGVNGMPYTDPNTTSTARSFVASETNGAGQLTGAYGCVSFIGPACLGVNTITYTLERKVTGFAGQLDYNFAFGFGDDIPFFGVDRFYVNPDAGESDSGEFIRFDRYQGFFGKIFDKPTDTFTIAWRPGGLDGSIGTDNSASFFLSNVIALLPGNGGIGGGPTPVPEPVSMAIFGLGLAALGAARRRRRAAA